MTATGITPPRVIPLGDESAWHHALGRVPHAFQHSHEFAQAMHLATGYRAFLLELSGEEGNVVCSLVERPIDDGLDIASASGLSGFAGRGDWPSVAPAWDEFVRDRGYVCGYVGIHPLFGPSGLSDAADPHNTLYVLDLGLGRDRLLKAMARNRRRELRGWEERRSQLVHDRGEIADFMNANYEAFMGSLGARPPLLTSEGLDMLCRSESCLVAATTNAGALDAAYLFGVSPHAGECLVNVSVGQGRRRSTDLVWYGATALMDREVSLLNLGGGVAEDDPVAQAKQRWGARRVPLRALRQIYRPVLYEKLCAALPPGSANTPFFPAYRSAAPVQEA